ncbi:hypothetical protein NLG42_10690 [Flavobacterium plurextorum]|uniref:hypothetical protein n=1 Tax=Flavobacterium TaxID=237 RepID=UPI00214DE6AE|nr:MULTISPECIES: hypothetical protein [Flavobacterium]UUW11255.1 hypothetical protein NLG42_10690 [Flavobacterium plurextorum]
MKTFLLCITASFLFISCSADADIESSRPTSVSLQNSESKSQSFKGDGNPFDIKGQNVYELLKVFYQNNQSPNSVAELTEQIRFVLNSVQNKKGITNRLIPFTDEMVEAILSDPDNSMILIVQNSTLQTYAKNNLINFLQNLISKRQEEFTITNNYILGYESDVLSDTIFTTEETETILTVASISRYSLYTEEERKDKDWDILVGSKHAQPFFSKNEVSIILVIALLEKLL